MASGVRDEREISTYIGRFVGKKLGETFDTHVGLVRAGSGGGGYERQRGGKSIRELIMGSCRHSS